jgi:hypothetical protein
LIGGKNGGRGRNVADVDDPEIAKLVFDCLDVP